ncbi:MAG: AAA family ATPase [Gammaproteobacteria bacterium]|nr:MAG: AAA family ATPase [Gammaproteobacteria bacterium]RKZ42625.1 MAG: AAA family ATPase [Gammaproteobacteria bacterium]RKZ76681.1 MAG: AAA family ATPase [Gammaproteobacteria bacterium]
MKIYRIGICGSHRTGKTTLAKAIATYKRIPFVQTSTRQVFEKHGLHPGLPMDFKTRLWIQHRVIEATITLWQAEKGSFVTDRTPIDFMAYTLADIQGATEVDFIDLEAYLTQCFNITNQFFTQLAVLQPAIPLVYEEGKAALNKAYIEHLNLLVQGLCHDERNSCSSIVIRRNIIDLEERVKALFK